MADIAALMVALSDLNAYKAANPDLMSNPQLLMQVLDVNGDGKIDNTDLQALIALVANNASGGGGGQLTAVPEPAIDCIVGHRRTGNRLSLPFATDSWPVNTSSGRTNCRSIRSFLLKRFLPKVLV